MIRSFACKHTRRIFQRTGTRRFPADLQQRAFARLNALDSATRSALADTARRHAAQLPDWDTSIDAFAHSILELTPEG